MSPVAAGWDASPFEDAVDVANPPTDCTEDCQAQNQVRGHRDGCSGVA